MAGVAQRIWRKKSDPHDYDDMALLASGIFASTANYESVDQSVEK
jgi:hypothetical protein